MNLTINTDASFKDGFSGYAFWIVCDAGKIQKAGKIKNKVDNSSIAELMCIANALHTLKHSRFKEIERVILNTDSMFAIQDITGVKNKKTTIQGKECQMLMMEILLKFGRSIREIDSFFTFKHVRAHSGAKDSRSFVNEWCDKEAKKYLKLRIKDN